MNAVVAFNSLSTLTGKSALDLFMATKVGAKPEFLSCTYDLPLPEVQHDIAVVARAYNLYESLTKADSVLYIFRELAVVRPMNTYVRIAALTDKDHTGKTAAIAFGQDSVPEPLADIDVLRDAIASHLSNLSQQARDLALCLLVDIPSAANVSNAEYNIVINWLCQLTESAQHIDPIRISRLSFRQYFNLIATKSLIG